MGIFYKPRPVPDETVLNPMLELARRTEAVDDPAQRQAQRDALLNLMRAGLSGGKLPDPVWPRVVGALVIAGILFAVALGLEDAGGHEESSKTVLRVFEVTFTAMLALLGIETAKA